YPRVAGWSPLQAITDGRWKTIAAGSASEIYDVVQDPREEHDLAASQAATAAAMRGRAEAIHGSGGGSQPRPVSAGARERLRALGYVASSAPAAPSGGAPTPAKEIAAWNAFEDALADLNAHKPQAADALKALADAHPDAVVFQSTYARALKDAGRPGAAL